MCAIAVAAYRKAVVLKAVDRFLGWKLPEDFHPDGGISFEPYFNVEYNAKQGKPPQRHEPIGTNLFTADQAKAMFEHVFAALPNSLGINEVSAQETGQSVPSERTPIEMEELLKDAARWRYIRSNVGVRDRMIGYCSRQYFFETDCEKRTIEEAVDAAMHPERT